MGVPVVVLRETIVLAACLVLAAGMLSAQPTTDQPAALLVYPHIEVDTVRGVDTAVQLSDTDSRYPASVSCFYETADHLCSSTSFTVNLTAGQPLLWRAGQGLSRFPIEQGGSSNLGSLIPPVPSDPFNGSLLCFVVDQQRLPILRDTLSGAATVERLDASQFDAAAYNAIGLGVSPIYGVPVDELVLGGPSGPYNACPLALIAMHYFDDALDAPTGTSRVSTRLVLVPCTQDLSGQRPREHVIQYIVTNEFEQRLTVSRIQTGCEQFGALSTIDASTPDRSIFNTAVQGTLTGRTRIYADQGTVGLLAVGIETHTELRNPTRTHRAMFNVATQGLQPDADFIILPGTAAYRACPGDCDRDGQVGVDELVRCVTIALNPSRLGACVACDADRDGDVSVNEIVSGVNDAFYGCP